MKKKVLKKRAHKLFSHMSMSKENETIIVGKPLRGREIKSLVSAGDRVCPLGAFEDILKFSTFNPSRKYILDFDTDNRMISIIRFCDPGPDRLGYTYLELLNLERRRRSQHASERKNRKNNALLEAIDD